MQSDTEYVESASGEAGVLANVGRLSGKMNDGLTRAFDAFFGPNEVDSFDASCNTCKHFQRKPMTPIEKSERNIFGMPGQCALKEIPTTGWQRGQYCGFENASCYENRRTGMRPADACKPKESN